MILEASAAPLSAPFPWPGGKSGIAAEVWDRFGKLDNFVEPFAGSLAVLLSNPHPPAVETANDSDAHVENFWRAVASDPEEVAHHADWPVHECALHARHAYLVKRVPWLTERLMGDPDWCDPKLAGWWVWGICAWIGSGWCSGKGPWVESGGRLMHRSDIDGAAGLSGCRLKLPHLSAGRGINRQGVRRKLPNLTAGYGGGTGIHGAGVTIQLPHLGGAWGTGPRVGIGINKATAPPILEWFQALQARLRRVRFTCGDWSRVLTPSVTYRHGLTGVFLDPPYINGNMEYSAGDPDPDLHERLVAWCRENQDNPQLRIALCGHDGDYDLPGWEILRWKARGGYGNQGKGADGESLDAEDNRHREAVWFNKSCLAGRQGTLFG